MANALVVQGGGPTAVVNASLVAAVRQAQGSGRTFSKFLGSIRGIKGILSDQVIDLFTQDRATLDGLIDAPGAALGSSREALSSAELEDLVDAFRRYDIRWLFWIGGNGSMGAALDVERAAAAEKYELQVIGIPKTADNDILMTDHTPGYGSAARFWAHAVRDMGMDHRSLPSPILICEVMGRNAGWVVAATALARYYEDDAPHLIYFPENPLPRHKLLADIEGIYRRRGRVFVCVCEGQLDENGEPFGADLDRPDTEYRLASNLGHAVAQYVSKELKVRVRSERPSLLGRCSSHLVSDVDKREAELCGREAVRAILSGESGKMVALRRTPSPWNYYCSTYVTPLESVARSERLVSDDMIAEEGNDVTQKFLEYASPLVGSVKHFRRLPL